MSEPIKIVVTAQTAQAAADLQKFVAQNASQLVMLNNQVAASGAKVASSVAGAANKARMGLMELEHTARATTDILLMGGNPRMLLAQIPQMLQSLTLMGYSLSTILPIVGGVAAAVGVGVGAWYLYTSAEREATERTRELNEALQKLPETLKNIANAGRAGILGPGQEQFLMNLVSGKEGFKVSMPARDAFMQGRISKEDLDKAVNETMKDPQLLHERIKSGAVSKYAPSGGKDYDNTFVKVEADLKERAAMANAELVKQGYLFEDLDKKGEKAGTFSVTPAGQAALDEYNLQKKVSLEKLSGIEKERAELKIKHDEEVQQYQQLEAIANANPPGGQTVAQRKLQSTLPALKKSIEDTYTGALANIDTKEQERMFKEQQESMANIRSDFSRDAASQEKELEQKITLNELQEGEKRGKNYQDEYNKRIFLAQQLLYSGLIDEKEYNEMVVQATIKKLVSQKEVNQELQREAQLRQEIARAQIEGKLTAIQGNPMLSDQEKAKQSVSLYQELMEANEKRIGDLKEKAVSDDKESLQAQKEIVELTNQQAELQNKMAAAKGENSVTYQMGGVIAGLKSANNLARETAHTFQNVFNTAVSSITSGIMGLINKTMTWRQALMSIATSVVQSIIEGIIQMGVRWLLTQAMMALGGRAILASAVASTVPIAAMQAEIWAIPATLATIASYGSAAVAAPLFIGLANAETMALAAFERGGRPPLGVPSLVGEAGPELFVPDTAGTIIPADKTADMLSSGRALGGGAGGSAGSPVHVHIWDKRPHPKDYLASPEGTHHFIELGKKHKVSMGFQT